MYELSVNGLLIDQNRCVVTNLDEKIELHDYDMQFDSIKNVKLSLLNKEANDTCVDTSGTIVDDLLIIVKKVVVDHIDLTNKLDKITNYRDSLGQVHKTFNYITFNGDYTIKIHKNLLYTEWFSSYL